MLNGSSATRARRRDLLNMMRETKADFRDYRNDSCGLEMKKLTAGLMSIAAEELVLKNIATRRS